MEIDRQDEVLAEPQIAEPAVSNFGRSRFRNNIRYGSEDLTVNKVRLDIENENEIELLQDLALLELVFTDNAKPRVSMAEIPIVQGEPYRKLKGPGNGRILNGDFGRRARNIKDKRWRVDGNEFLEERTKSLEEWDNIAENNLDNAVSDYEMGDNRELEENK